MLLRLRRLLLLWRGVSRSAPARVGGERVDHADAFLDQRPNAIDALRACELGSGDEGVGSLAQLAKLFEPVGGVALLVVALAQLSHGLAQRPHARRGQRAHS